MNPMPHNLGRLDRILRFALAFWWLGPWAPRYDIGLVNALIFIVAWIALAESFAGWCWIHSALKINNKDQ